MQRSLLPFLVFAVTFSTASAQTCGPNEVLLRNDNLPAVPSGLTGAAVIQGLCENEGMGAVFDVSGIGQQVQIKRVAGALLNAGGANGVNCVVNLQIYDGVTFSGGVPVLGPLVFDWAAATGTNISFTSSAINTHDISGNNVVVTSGQAVVCWTMLFNLGAGTCASGYSTNFATDFTAGGFNPPCMTNQQTNLIFITGQGWRLVENAQVSGIPICGGFFNAYNGNWIIRACAEDVTPQNPLTMNFLPTDTYTPNGFPHLVQFNVDVIQNPGLAGQLFIPIVSATLGTTPFQGFDIPVLIDFVTNEYFNNPAVKAFFDLTPPVSNYFGVVPPAGSATGIISIPASFAPPFPIPLHFCFMTVSGPSVTAVSAAHTLTLTP